MAGLLSPEEQSQINNDALGGLAMGLLSASGPSRVPVSMGQAMAQGMQGFQQGRSQAEMMAMKRKQMEQEAQHNAMMNEMNQMKLAEMKRQNELRSNAANNLGELGQRAQQYYKVSGDAAGAFKMDQTDKIMAQAQSLMGGGMQPAARPYQDQVNPGQFQVSNDQQANTLMDDLKKLEAINPQEAAKVRESLVQQGLIKPPMQQTQPNVNDIARFGFSVAGVAPEIGKAAMEYAKFTKPEWATIDNGGSIQGYNKNSQANPFGNSPIVKQMSPDSVASNALGRDRLEFDRMNSAKPQYKDGTWVVPPTDGNPTGKVIETPLYNPPKGSAKANEIASTKVISLLDQADKLLNTSTGSYLGTARDKAASIIGESTTGAQSAAQLKALEGQIMMAQPRMEGPQSDKDVAMYRQMAGQIGDSTVPVETRRAAIKGIKMMHEKYAGQDTVLQPSLSGAKTATLADIAATAKASGRSTAEVTQALREKGYTIGGM